MKILTIFAALLIPLLVLLTMNYAFPASTTLKEQNESREADLPEPQKSVALERSRYFIPRHLKLIGIGYPISTTLAKDPHFSYNPAKSFSFTSGDQQVGGKVQGIIVNSKFASHGKSEKLVAIETPDGYVFEYTVPDLRFRTSPGEPMYPIAHSVDSLFLLVPFVWIGKGITNSELAVIEVNLPLKSNGSKLHRIANEGQITNILQKSNVEPKWAAEICRSSNSDVAEFGLRFLSSAC